MGASLEELRKRVEKAIEEFNKYREPEAVARLVSLSEREIVLEIAGPYCRSCGLADWFDDFTFELIAAGGPKAVFADYEPSDEADEAYAVTYRIESNAERDVSA